MALFNDIIDDSPFDLFVLKRNVLLGRWIFFLENVGYLSLVFKVSLMFQRRIRTEMSETFFTAINTKYCIDFIPLYLDPFLWCVY